VIADLFSGARGWEARSDVEAVGFEHDRDACRTSAAAGRPTIRCDLFDYPIPSCDLEGLIASPPCQPFSRAGKRAGIAELQAVVAHIDRCAAGWHEPEADWRRDPRIGLVVEPLRWALAKRPDWITWEQVPDVLPIWEACARVLRVQGWSAWTGCLSAEQYGVPQTRERAFLLASRSKLAQPPQPTHQAYRPGEPALTLETVDLFGDTVLPWVSMADALGWGLPDRPCWTVAGGGTETGGAEPIANAANQARLEVLTRGQRGDAFNPERRPAWALTSKTDSWVLDVIAGPGYRTAGDGPRQNAPGSVKITLEDALTLQSFPRDWPLQGTKTSKFRQVGNAVPPVLAAAVLDAVAPRR